MIDLKIAPEDERPVHDLPGGLVLGVQVSLGIGEFDRPIEPIAQLVVGWKWDLGDRRRRLAAAQDRREKQSAPGGHPSRVKRQVPHRVRS